MNDLSAQEGPWAAGFRDTGELGGTVEAASEYPHPRGEPPALLAGM